MLILTGSRASGKTYNLLRECNNNNGVVLVKDRPQKVNLKKYAKSLGFDNVRVQTYIEHMQDVSISPVYIDSLEDLLHSCFPGKVAGIVTSTAEVISLNPYRVDEERGDLNDKLFH